MPFYTPLRYPGGKRRLAATVMSLLDENRLTDVEYVEPFAGGAAIALALLFEEYAATVHINDLSRPVYAFWHTVLNNPESLCQRIERADITTVEWNRQRAIYENQGTADIVDLGFATLFLNRTNRSGIIGGGVIGGKQQTGAYPIDARFTKREIIQRIRKISRYRDRIRLYQLDALEFSTAVLPRIGLNAFVFYDPPYIGKGKGLYLNNFGVDDHRKLADQIVQLHQPWIVTYDYDAASKFHLYPQHRHLVYDLSYSAQTRSHGKEVMFLSHQLRLPRRWQSESRIEMAGDGRYQVYGMLENLPANS